MNLYSVRIILYYTQNKREENMIFLRNPSKNPKFLIKYNSNVTRVWD